MATPVRDIAPSELLRLFVAVELPERVKNELGQAQEELRRSVPSAAIRWTDREQFHLTLKFLGDVDATRAGVLADALRAACRGLVPFDLRAEGLGFFPDARRPRVIWAGLRDAASCLNSLQQAVETAARDFSEQGPEQRFEGHVTLGRVKSLKRPEAEHLASAASRLGAKSFGEWRVEEVKLMRSELSAQGARHTCLAAIPLPGLS